MGQFDNAIQNFNYAVETCAGNCSEDIRREVYYGLGIANMGVKDYETSKENHLKSLEIARSAEDYRMQTLNLHALGEIAKARNDLDEAKKYLLQAQDLGEKTDHVEVLIDVYKDLSSVYVELKDFQNASIYQSKYIHYKDSIYSDNLISNLASVQTKFEERKNIQTIADKESALSRQRLLNIAVIIIAVLAGLLVFVLYRSNMITRKVNADLSDAKSIIENQNRELTKAKSELEVKVDIRTNELSVANESLQRVNGELDNFIYKTSHDIRGPLASLQGICNVALMDVKDQMAIDYLRKLDFTASKLNTILTRLLIINQINNSSPVKTEIDFQSMVDDVLLLERKKGLPSNLKITYSIENEIHFKSDPELVRIILENLIDNAIKFHNDSGRIDPFVQINIRNNNSSISIHVIDNGIGVKKADSGKIFQIFSRASERSDTGGIGLYLSKLASEKLNGEINFRTTPEGFTEFYAEFPVEP
jgi:signal transduction histidine kinase